MTGNWSIADLTNRWRHRFSRSRELSEHLRLGARGEKLACAFLRRKGYRILSAGDLITSSNQTRFSYEKAAILPS